ncbi:hypothetical protein GCM10009661_43710 [Catellatospora chokoriensis]
MSQRARTSGDTRSRRGPVDVPGESVRAVVVGTGYLLCGDATRALRRHPDGVRPISRRAARTRIYRANIARPRAAARDGRTASVVKFPIGRSQEDAIPTATRHTLNVNTEGEHVAGTGDRP